MKNYTALKPVSLQMNYTINLHEHGIQKDILSMTIPYQKSHVYIPKYAYLD